MTFGKAVEWACYIIVPLTVLELIARMPWLATHTPLLDSVKYLIYPGYKAAFVIMGDVRATTLDFKLLQPLLGAAVNVFFLAAVIYGVAWAMGKTDEA